MRIGGGRRPSDLLGEVLGNGSKTEVAGVDAVVGKVLHFIGDELRAFDEEDEVVLTLGDDVSDGLAEGFEFFVEAGLIAGCRERGDGIDS